MSVKFNQQMRKLFARRLRGHRLLSHFPSARAFAEGIGENADTYTRWERAETIPSLDQLMRICFALQITPNDLLWPERKKPQNIELIEFEDADD